MVFGEDPEEVERVGRQARQFGADVLIFAGRPGVQRWRESGRAGERAVFELVVGVNPFGSKEPGSVAVVAVTARAASVRTFSTAGSVANSLSPPGCVPVVLPAIRRTWSALCTARPDTLAVTATALLPEPTVCSQAAVCP